MTRGFCFVCQDGYIYLNISLSHFTGSPASPLSKMKNKKNSLWKQNKTQKNNRQTIKFAIDWGFLDSDRFLFSSFCGKKTLDPNYGDRFIFGNSILD